MEKTLMMPASYNLMAEEEMTYTSGGATAIEALCAWIIPFYGWFKGSMSVRNYRRAHPNTWVDTGLDALSNHMASSSINLIYDIGCAAQFIGVCSTGIGLIPTALIVLS